MLQNIDVNIIWINFLIVIIVAKGVQQGELNKNTTIHNQVIDLLKLQLVFKIHRTCLLGKFWELFANFKICVLECKLVVDENKIYVSKYTIAIKLY